MLGRTAKFSTTVAVHVNIATLSHPSLLNRCVSTGWMVGGGAAKDKHTENHIILHLLAVSYLPPSQCILLPLALDQ